METFTHTQQVHIPQASVYITYKMFSIVFDWQVSVKIVPSVLSLSKAKTVYTSYLAHIDTFHAGGKPSFHDTIYVHHSDSPWTVIILV